jgi:IS605 OrfB family transposase
MASVPRKTLHLKVRPEAWSWLDKAAIEVNQVWNWANATSAQAAQPYAGAPRWLSGYDLDALSSGAGPLFARIGADTVNQVNHQYALKRRVARKVRLRWRSSKGSKRALGWIPLRGDNIRGAGSRLRFMGKTFRVYEQDALLAYRSAGGKFRAGSFAQNALGEWFLNIGIEIPTQVEPIARGEAVGIDLGLKAVATTSDGEVLEAGRFYRGIEQKMGQAQRRGHKKQAKRLHAKAANRRKDALHKFTTGIVRQYQAIVVGDVSAPQLAKTRMAKSVLDSGWGMLRTQLQYKGHQAGRTVEVVNERYTTRACSSCGQHTGPSGLRHLVVREWICMGCGAAHDRDVNAARNILALRYPASICGNKPARHGMSIGVAAQTITQEAM